MKQRLEPKFAAVAALYMIGCLIFLGTHFTFDPFGLSNHGSVLIALLGAALLVLIAKERILPKSALLSRQHLKELAIQAEQNAGHLEKQVEWLEMTEALAHVGHWRMTFADNELFWSEETYRIHGWPQDRTPTLADATSVYHPDDRQAVVDAVETARRTGEPYRFRARLIRPDGDVRHVEAVAQIENNADGMPLAMFGVFADRTEEEKMRRALVKASDSAFAAANAKSTFLANMSHEIRTPMNGVVGFSDLLCRSDLPPRERQFAEIISDSARSMTLLLNDILDLSKIEAGQLEMREQPTDIGQLLHHVARLVRNEAQEKGLELTLDIAEGLPDHCLTDPLRLRQVLSNLLGNAIKFTDAGFVAIHAHWRDEVLSISIRDSGIGISQQDIDKIFDSFGQGGNHTYNAQGGTGLGLAISRQLATALGGSLTVESQLSEGSVFKLQLRAIQVEGQLPKALGMPQDEDISSPDRSLNRRVLLAEDFDVNQMLVQAMAEQAGIDLVVAENGQVALAKVQQAEAEGRPFALILMDLQMPVMDGHDATIRLRSKGYDAAELPIIAMTANAFADDISECKKIGMQDHLAKPVNFDQFQTMLEKWLPSDHRHAA